MDCSTRETFFPLASQQLSYWNAGQVSAKFHSGCPIVTAYSLLGGLDIESLVRSFRLFVERHDALRLRIRVVEGSPRQKISSPDDFKVEVIDLPNKRNARELAKNIVEDLATRSEDIVDRSLFDVKLIKIGCRENVLVLMTDHIISDRWSANILFRELSFFYKKLLEGRAEGLDWPAQYSEYIVWQKKWFSSAEAKKHIDYVCDAVAATKPIAPPGALKAPIIRKWYAITICELSELQLEKLNKCASNYGIKLSFLLSTIYAHALSCWSGLEELVIYSIFNGRRQAKFLNTFGYFAYSILFRVFLRKGIEFADALKVVPKSIINGYMHHGAMNQAIPEWPVCFIKFWDESLLDLALDGVTIQTLDCPQHPFWVDNPKINILAYLTMIRWHGNVNILLSSTLLSEEALTPLVHRIRERIGEVLAS